MCVKGEWVPGRQTWREVAGDVRIRTGLREVAGVLGTYVFGLLVYPYAFVLRGLRLCLVEIDVTSIPG